MIVLHRPVDFFASPTAPRTIQRFFDLAEWALRARGAQVVIVDQRGTAPDLDAFPAARHVTYHTRIERRGVWNAKVSYLPEHFYLDPRGYAGWSTLAVTGFDPATVPVSTEACAAFVTGVREELEASNRSKYAQPPQRDLDLPPYVFVPTQVADDSILALGRVGVEEMIRGVATALAGTGWCVVFKRHPKCRSETVESALRQLGALPHVRVVDASIHDLIRGAAAVLTINSGVGFESLLYFKRVFTLGVSDYEVVTRALPDLGALRGVPAELSAPFDPTHVARFVWHFLQRFTVSVRDERRFCDEVARRLLGGV